jgi:hypothetical protein
MNRPRHGTASALRRRGSAGLVLVGALLVARRAPAALTIEHQPGGDGCAEAATYFPEDSSALAQRARRRCRLEIFERQLEEKRLRSDALADQRRDRVVEKWMEAQEIPNRVVRRNFVDLFAAGGLTSYGLAVGGVFLPWLEGELWGGRRSVAESLSNGTGYLWDSRTCLGGRLKWLMRGRGNVTPFTSLGAAGCSAHVQFNPYVSAVAFPGGDPTNVSTSDGDGSAHLATASAGLTWTEKSGFRASLEYAFAYAFYTQATLNDKTRTEDVNLRTAWESRLTTDRAGVRLQVGYAF